ncbi:leucoanthocyanidin reductase-like isoform X2 [Musa acuminata AAA Group]|uniref:(wild Malaysian banana) hypothetical protein n=1 Tax=Musa acuminata subsp. malaccensis TaxID=214687 RepID=A0A804J555_MUSAM|nr:PREDICTED: leucoanthocyanidin reductase-like isoform X2 [Musa acuminata subsp. malaccensis]CAG1838921.1 unnamed protein product [Musa acuminata subsp. malaccensis]
MASTAAGHELAPTTGATLVVGGTGYIGRFVAEAGLALGHALYVLVRTFGPFVSPSRAATAAALREKGAIILEGSVDDKDFMEKTLRENNIHVVISAVGGESILDQLCLLDAIQAAGTVKRFLPSEFGHDIDKANPVEPALSLYNRKRRVRRAVEAAGVPYTYICCNSIAGWPYHDNKHPSKAAPPLDRFVIYGDGSVRAFFVAGSDIGKFTMRSAFDSRTVNRAVHFRPTCNCVSLNEMASLWERKIGRTLPRVRFTEEDLLAIAKENEIPASVVAALTHDIFILGCQSNYSVDGVKDVEVSCLYPDMAFRTLDDCFSDYISSLLPHQARETRPSAAAATVDQPAVPPATA